MTKGVFKDLVGQRFGLLTVLRRATEKEAPRGHGTKTKWLVRCDCGQERLASGPLMKEGRLKACDINGHSWASEVWKNHVPSERKQSLEYRSWARMKQRCFNPKNENYLYYGGRGITVCERWKNSFHDFLADMGARPGPEYSIERIDVNGNYEPSNCRWATDAEQRLNTQRTVYVEDGGEKIRLQDFAKKLGLRPNVIYTRLKLGWTLEQAVTIPVRQKTSKKAVDK